MMRISTVVSHQLGVNAMTSQEAKVLETMQQLASGKRALTPADDPLAAAQAVNVAQTESLNLRYATNRDVARQNLYLQEESLTTVSTVLQEVSTRLVEAGNGSYSDADRGAVAMVLREMRETLLGHANATDGNGQYLYSGNKGGSQPFVQNAVDDSVAYTGDDGQRVIQVAQTRQMASSDSGADVFRRASPGSLDYYAEAGANNAGTATFGKVELVNPAHADVTSDVAYDIGFTANPAYDATDPDSAQWLLSATAQPAGTPVGGVDGMPYKEGEAITLGGVRVALDGEPDAGDTFRVQPSATADLDIFATLTNVINALEQPITNNPVAAADLNNALNTANRKVSMHFDNVLTVRASVGARLNELDALDNEGANRGLNYTQQLSALEDLDYRAASSDMAVRTMALQAAELAYMKTQGLGLFSRGR